MGCVSLLSRGGGVKGRTVCCVHDVVEVVDCYAAVSPCFSGYATAAVLAFVTGFVSALSREESCCGSVSGVTIGDQGEAYLC